MLQGLALLLHFHKQNYYYSVLLNTKGCSKVLRVTDTILLEGVRLLSASEYHQRKYPVVLPLPLPGCFGSPKARPAHSNKCKKRLLFSVFTITLNDPLQVNGVKIP
jgi:hypothetical protein